MNLSKTLKKTIVDVYQVIKNYQLMIEKKLI